LKHADEDDEDEDEGAFAQPKDRSSKKRRTQQRRRRWLLASTVLMIVLVIAAFFYSQYIGVNLPATVAAYFVASATATQSTNPNPTEFTHSATPNPLLPVETATLTPEPVIVEPTATATLQDTATATATITETLLPSPTPLGGGPSQIAFASDRTGIMQIWLMNADGSQQRQITSEKDGACQPTWSPDGMRLAFISPCPGKQETYRGASIYLINVDGTGLMPLPASPEGDYDPAWSPNGRYIAFTSLRNGKSAIFKIDLETQAIEELSRARFPDKQPAWAPSGLEIAFVRQYVTGQIWKMSESGDLQSKFSVSGNVNNLMPAWANDGTILFYSQTSPTGSIPWLVYQRYEDRGQSRESRIPAKPSPDVGPITDVNCSPDGFWLAFEGWPDGNNHDIYIMNVNGANQKRLTTDRGMDLGPVWRPTTPLP
jgi:Tol biopolymer transport system component